MRRVSVALAIVSVWVMTPITHVQAASLTVTCRADVPVPVGQPMTFRATVQGNVGTPSYFWSGADGVTGSTSVAMHTYSTIGMKVAYVQVHDPGSGEDAAADCGMHVLPATYVENPSVTPVLWVPNGVDPTPMVGQLKRTWRMIHALFFHFYGKTFRMRAMQVIVSAKPEADLCGGDCTDLGKADTLVSQATADASAAIGGTIPYTRAMLVMAWGAGGWAGSYSWDVAHGTIGDFAIAPAALRKIPHIESGVGNWLVSALGLYDDAVFGSIAHELNHLIAWDDPHDFSLHSPPNQYERSVSLAGPFLTRNLPDTVEPTASITAPTGGSTTSGTTNVQVDASDAAMDAVVLLVDQQPVGIDRAAPFQIPLDTTKLSVDDHELTAIAIDTTGNFTHSSPVTVHVVNEVHDATCDTAFPVGTFRACFYDGIGTTGAYLGSWYDGPFPYPATNVALGPSHDWAGGEVAFERADDVTGVWRGKFDFPAGLYELRFHTDDGLKVWIDGHLAINAWTAPQIADLLAEAQLSGRTRIKVQWFENDGAASLSMRWSPPTT